ncbi:MAG: hypothetical protein ACTSRU_20540 [Candidatus Hodarchaeales archaeon]
MPTKKRLKELKKKFPKARYYCPKCRKANYTEGIGGGRYVGGGKSVGPFHGICKECGHSGIWYLTKRHEYGRGECKHCGKTTPRTTTTYLGEVVIRCDECKKIHKKFNEYT